MLEQISYLGKFWFLRYGPKCSWPIKLQDMLINRRTLKSAISHKEINEINWFLVCSSNSLQSLQEYSVLEEESIREIKSL